MIMSPEHPQWNEFCNKLDDMITDEKCDGKSLRLAKIILENWPSDDPEPIDVQDTLQYFVENGGYCDCEILMNVGDN